MSRSSIGDSVRKKIQLLQGLKDCVNDKNRSHLTIIVLEEDDYLNTERTKLNSGINKTDLYLLTNDL